jgi:molybdenum cofactor cytidylyltransferase
MAEPMLPAAAILLAAGSSSRLGQPKQLVELHGESLLTRAVRAAHQAGAVPIWVVLSPAMAEVGRAALAAGDASMNVVVVENSAAAEGMGGSLRAGMRALLHAKTIPARVLLLVCDQPLVTAAHLRLLLATPSPHGIVAAAYGGRTGVPAVFRREHYAALAQARGDSGARELLRSLPATTVDLPEAGVDVDTPEQLQELLRR